MRRLLAAIAAACLSASCDALLLRSAHGNTTASVGAGAAATNTSMPPRGPRVYFLFLAVDKISNLDVWNAFFARAPHEQYRALVHCKQPSCVQQVAGSPFFVVPSVPSYYCTDLVSPMNQLLSWAIWNDRLTMSNPADKFAFVSDSSLPAKPFAHIYRTLSVRQGSDFCVFPSNEWADIPSSGGLEMAVKTHQWLTLERAHAEKALALWHAGKMHNFMSYFRMNTQSYTWANNSFADSRNFGCLDEFWHMAALYGTMHHNDVNREQYVQLSMFAGGPLRISPQAGWQGECDTFVVWSKYLHTAGNNPFNRLHSSLDQVSVPHGGNLARPGWWDTISTTGLRAIRHSDFLFVRKFIDRPRLYDGSSFADSYAQLVLAA